MLNKSKLDRYKFRIQYWGFSNVFLVWNLILFVLFVLLLILYPVNEYFTVLTATLLSSDACIVYLERIGFFNAKQIRKKILQTSDLNMKKIKSYYPKLHVETEIEKFTKPMVNQEFPESIHRIKDVIENVSLIIKFLYDVNTRNMEEVSNLKLTLISEYQVTFTERFFLAPTIKKISEFICLQQFHSIYD